MPAHAPPNGKRTFKLKHAREWNGMSLCTLYNVLRVECIAVECIAFATAAYKQVCLHCVLTTYRRYHGLG